MKLKLSTSIGIIMIGLTTISCELTTKNYESKLEWLKGSWICKHQSKIAKEHWRWNTEKKCYEATGMMVHLKDTVYTQKLKIHNENNDLFLSVNTKDETTSKEAFFKLVNSNVDSLVFKNVFEKFPKYVVYINKGNQITTKALGLKNGHNIMDIRTYDKLK